MNPTSQSFNIGGSTFGFSGIGVDDLEASEYTLVVIAVDMSGSVYGFVNGITACVKSIIEACRADKRADNLLIRVVTFNTRLAETHGFKPLMSCNAPDYDRAFQAGGGTALFDAAYTGIGSVDTYAQTLKDDDYAANAIVFIVTDGDDNSSSMSAAAVAQKAKEARGIGVAKDNVALESLLTVLVGVNVTDPNIAGYLQAFEQEGEFDQYVELGNADAKTLAKLANFVSASISSQSQALGTGGPSQVIDPNSLSI